jgi:hypothetical protein
MLETFQPFNITRAEWRMGIKWDEWKRMRTRERIFPFEFMFITILCDADKSSFLMTNCCVCMRESGGGRVGELKRQGKNFFWNMRIHLTDKWKITYAEKAPNSIESQSWVTFMDSRYPYILNQLIFGRVALINFLSLQDTFIQRTP